jgi:group I intron endonuclease
MKLWQIKDLYPNFTQYDPSAQRAQLLQELKNVAGIYCWYNLSRDSFYIGSSDNLRQRMSCYLSLAYLISKKDNSIINRALLKYGFSSFILLILETLEQGRKEQLLELEQRAIDLCNPPYNILTKAGSSLGFKHALETLAKMSEIKKGELNPMFGKEKSPEF